MNNWAGYEQMAFVLFVFVIGFIFGFSAGRAGAAR